MIEFTYYNENFTFLYVLEKQLSLVFCTTLKIISNVAISFIYFYSFRMEFSLCGKMREIKMEGDG